MGRSNFRVNYHIAKPMNELRVDRMIENYPSQYSTPKYMTFMWQMIKSGWEVKLHVVKDSKYVFTSKGDLIFKTRFSSHKPSYHRQKKNDCDFYVGISHKQVHTTDQIIKMIKEIEHENRNQSSDSA
jgi:hypothetical protein